MDLKDILSIGGKPGLFRFISQAKNGIIVEGLKDKKRMPAYSHDKVSSLEDIAIFTETDEVPLGQVFASIYKHLDGKMALSHKSSPDELKAFFEGVLPDYDKDRVYVSDIRKVVSWYNILHELEMVDGEYKKEDEEKADDDLPADAEKKDDKQDKGSGK